MPREAGKQRNVARLLLNEAMAAHRARRHRLASSCMPERRVRGIGAWQQTQEAVMVFLQARRGAWAEWPALSPRVGRPLARTPVAILAHGLPVLSVLLVLTASLWAVSEHVRQKTELQRAETTRYLVEFSQGPVAQARARLREVWQAELIREVPQSPAGSARLAQLATDYRWFVLDVIAQHHLANEVDLITRFYRRLALCIRMGSCSRAIAAQELGDAARQFRDQLDPYLQEAYGGKKLDDDFRVITSAAARKDR